MAFLAFISFSVFENLLRPSWTLNVVRPSAECSSSRSPFLMASSTTFKDGTTIDRYTYFVYEDGGWKHRFSQEEIDLFMPGVPYDEFVAAQQ